MPHYRFRLNLQPAPKESMWRVWEDDVESNQASDIIIEVPSRTEITIEDYPDRFGRFEKYNIGCDGNGHWNGNILTIKN